MITASVVITQTTSTAAPEFVHLDCSGTTATGITYPFHQLRYLITWGERRSGTWALTGSRKNISRSPIAGHVYENPGTYTIRVLIQQFNLTTGALVDQVVVQRLVTVTDPDDEWPLATNTILYSTNGAETDWNTAPYDAVPAGNKKTFADFDTVEADVSAGNRVLLKRGQTFTGTQVIALSNSHGYLGTWSQGGDDPAIAKPVLNNGISAEVASFDFRVLDLDFQGAGIIGSSAGSADPNQAKEYVVVRCESHNYSGTAITLGGNPNSATPPNMFCLYECTVINVAGFPGSNIAFTWWERCAALGCDLDDSLDAEHVWRTMLTQRVVFAHTRFANARKDKGCVTFRCQPNGRESQWCVWDDCIIEMSTEQLIGFSTSTNNESQVHDIRDVIVQNSVFKAPASQTATQGQAAMQVFGHRYTIRNNKFFAGTTAASNAHFWGISLADKGQAGNGNRSDHIWVYGNSIYSGVSDPVKVRLLTSGDGSLFDDVWIRNNVVHGPSTHSDSWVWTMATPGGTFSTGNNGGNTHIQNATFTFTDPDWKNNSPTQASDMVPADEVGPLIDAGALNADLGIFDDFEGRPRSGSIVEAGASEAERRALFPSTRYVH